MTLFFYITNTPKNSVETLSTLDTMKIPLHREDQTKITFKTELNGSKRFYTTITKKKKKVDGSLELSQLLIQKKCFPTIKVIQPKENGENALGSYLVEKHGCYLMKKHGCWRTVL